MNDEFSSNPPEKNKPIDEIAIMSECDGCRFTGLELKKYPAPPFDPRGRKDPFNFCDLCASTFIGNAVQYPEQYENSEIMRLIGYCTNLILREIERAKP